MVQHVITGGDDFVSRFESVEEGVIMSWSLTQTGASSLRSTLRKDGAWLVLVVRETPTEGRSKQTFCTLKQAAARALYEQLHAVYGKG